MHLNHRHRYSRPDASIPSPPQLFVPTNTHQALSTDSGAAAPLQTDQSSLSNPWDDDSQHGPRSRVRSMHEQPYLNSQTRNTHRNTDLLNPNRPGLHHRRSTGDFRPHAQTFAPFHSAYPAPHRDINELGQDPEVVITHNLLDQGAKLSQSRGEAIREPSLPISSSNLDDVLRRFQDGKLDDHDQEWHRLVPEEAQGALGKKEVRRQSVMFEIIKGERDYVADLELVQLLFIDGLRSTRPQVIPEGHLSDFITGVFGNLHEILALHRQLMYALFERQREQHPLLQTVADIILDRTIRTEFRSAYEVYIKNYPLAETYHRNQLKRNLAYEQFIQSISNDPRVRKRDLITFLSRPVTRLPRLSLLLEETLKSTERDFEHPDLETLPLILNILRDCIKSTQPGIEAAEGKVKFWMLCESLVEPKSEIIDMDLYDQSRTLVHSGPVMKKVRSDVGFHEWDDFVASLLDNHFILTKEANKRGSSSVQRHLMSRPLHLSYLQLGSFDDFPDTRKEKPEGRLLDSLRFRSVPIFPFTIFHSSSPSAWRYTLYVASEAQRKKWKNMLSEAISLHRVREDSGKWFDPQNMTSSFFRVPGRVAIPPQVSMVTGRITSAVPFSFAGRKFLVVGCPTGVFVSVAGHEDFKKVFHYSNPNYMAALQTVGSSVFNRFLVYCEPVVVSYSLELLARLTLGQATTEMLNASMEKIDGSGSNTVFCKYLQLNGRALVILASKRRLSTSLTLQIMEAVGQAEMESMTREKGNTRVLSFRPFGEPGFIPRDAFDVTALTKNIAICTQDEIVIADPTNLARSVVTIVPDLHDAGSNLAMTILKDQLRDARPLGLVRVDANELLLIYDSIGCYITKRGIPSRSCGFIKWETQASGFAYRGHHVLLISSRFIEIRNINTGRIVQVIEGVDVRLMYSGVTTSDKDDRVLVAMRGTQSTQSGDIPDRIIELVETVEFILHSVAPAAQDMWDEWDM